MTGFVHPFSPAARQDPGPAYAWLTDHDPLHDDPETGAVLLARYADCDALLRHRDASTAQGERGTRLPPSMLTTDPPEHTRLRAIGARLVGPAAVAALRPTLDDDVAAVLIGAGTAFEAYDDVGVPLSVRVLARLLDVPDDERDQFGRLADAASVNLDPRSAGPQGARSAAMLAFYLRARLQLSQALQRWLSGAGCTEAEAIGVLSLCVIGGLEPLAVTIAAALLSVAGGPGPTPAGVALDVDALVEDVLRLGTPIPLVARAVHTDVLLPSGTLPAGSRALVLLDAANRDAANRDAANRDAAEVSSRHLSFGAGPHFCLGAPLVRAVLSSVVACASSMSLVAEDEPRAWGSSLVPRRLRPIHLRTR